MRVLIFNDFTPFLMKFALLTLSPKPLLASVPFIFPTLSVSFLPTLHSFMNCFHYTFPPQELYCRDFWLLWLVWNLRSAAGHSADAQNILFAIKCKSKQPQSFVWHRPATQGNGSGHWDRELTGSLLSFHSFSRQMMQHQLTASPRHNLRKPQKTSPSPSGCMCPTSPSGSGIQTSDKCLV